jgi:hypothetical protein
MEGIEGGRLEREARRREGSGLVDADVRERRGQHAPEAQGPGEPGRRRDRLVIVDDEPVPDAEQAGEPLGCEEPQGAGEPARAGRPRGPQDREGVDHARRVAGPEAAAHDGGLSVAEGDRRQLLGVPVDFAADRHGHVAVEVNRQR